MALRRPLVLVLGSVRELPLGDSLPGSGGGSTVTQLILPVSTPVMEVVQINVSVPGVLATDKITVALVPSEDNEAEDLKDDGIRVFAVPSANNILFTLLGNGLIVGPFTINYGVAS